jgi:hypothetical protein
MKSTVFWILMPSGSEKAQGFGGTYHLHLQDQKVKQDGGRELRPACCMLLLVFCLGSSSTLNTDVVCSTEVLGFP